MRRQVRYQGRVQGVGFRMTAHQAAAKYPVTGWVRNEPDGSVLMAAQGKADDIDRFIGEVARVMGRYIRSKESVDLPDEPGEAGFVIRH
jgi:acylphosphatase